MGKNDVISVSGNFLIGKDILLESLDIHDLFNELHRRLTTESELFVACNRPTSSMMVAICDEIDEAHHVYTDLTTNPVEAWK